MGRRILRSLILMILLLFTASAIYAGYMIADTLLTARREAQEFQSLSAQIRPDNSAPAGVEMPVYQFPAGIMTPEDTEPVIRTLLPKYAELYQSNPDLFGWISIPDTRIDYPVMFTPMDKENGQFYIHRAFNKGSSESGTPFMDLTCFDGCGNYLIYGHNMKDKSMFGSLTYYQEKEYWQEHPVIYFDTMYEEGEYEILSVFLSRIYGDKELGFHYYEYTDLTDPNVYREYVLRAKGSSLYDTGVTAVYGDQLITLSTCSYHTVEGRLVVVARKK